MEFNLSQKQNEGTTLNKNNKPGRQKGLDEHQFREQQRLAESAGGSATESPVGKPFNISHLAQLFFPSHTSEPKSMDMREIARRAFDLNSEQREQVLNVIRQMKDLLKPITKPPESGGMQQQAHTEQTSPQQADGEVWQELPEEEWQDIQKHILKEREITWQESHKEDFETIWNENREICGEQPHKMKNDIKEVAEKIQTAQEVFWLCKHLANIASGAQHWEPFGTKKDETESAKSKKSGSKGNNDDFDDDYDYTRSEIVKLTKDAIKKEAESLENAISGKVDPEQIRRSRGASTKQLVTTADEILEFLSKLGKKLPK